tara:strand:+ start:3859 stop:4512 length:654 start_codon:yes stop_codon:yes gene_type:complete
MTYPVTIVDDFFEDPDGIVEMAEELSYYNPNTGNWPGTRTKQLHVENPRFFNYFGAKLHSLFHDTIPEYWNLQCHFQKIMPFCKDKYSKQNQGWIHQDHDTFFGGIVYLKKDPEPDTGTSIYKVKRGFSFQFQQELKMKESIYKSEIVDETEYNKAFDAMRNQFVETVRVENVYNRLLLFNNKAHHGVKTFGSTERLTLNFFGMGQYGKMQPLVRTK